jgi:hypothetical protein
LLHIVTKGRQFATKYRAAVIGAGRRPLILSSRRNVDDKTMRRFHMFRSIAAPALAALISFAAVSEAGAWSRGGSFTGPRGTSNWGASGRCSGGACSSQGGGSGPRGGAWSRSGSVSR